jgi:hypothetical protein
VRAHSACSRAHTQSRKHDRTHANTRGVFPSGTGRRTRRSASRASSATPKSRSSSPAEPCAASGRPALCAALQSPARSLHAGPYAPCVTGHCRSPAGVLQSTTRHWQDLSRYESPAATWRKMGPSPPVPSWLRMARAGRRVLRCLSPRAGPGGWPAQVVGSVAAWTRSSPIGSARPGATVTLGAPPQSTLRSASPQPPGSLSCLRLSWPQTSAEEYT